MTGVDDADLALDLRGFFTVDGRGLLGITTPGVAEFPSFELGVSVAASDAGVAVSAAAGLDVTDLARDLRGFLAGGAAPASVPGAVAPASVPGVEAPTLDDAGLGRLGVAGLGVFTGDLDSAAAEATADAALTGSLTGDIVATDGSSFKIGTGCVIDPAMGTLVSSITIVGVAVGVTERGESEDGAGVTIAFSFVLGRLRFGLEGGTDASPAASFSVFRFRTCLALTGVAVSLSPLSPVLAGKLESDCVASEWRRGVPLAGRDATASRIPSAATPVGAVVEGIAAPETGALSGADSTAGAVEAEAEAETTDGFFSLFLLFTGVVVLVAVPCSALLMRLIRWAMELPLLKGCR